MRNYFRLKHKKKENYIISIDTSMIISDIFHAIIFIIERIINIMVKEEGVKITYIRW